MRVRLVPISLFFALMITYASVNCYFHTFRNLNVGTFGWTVSSDKKIKLDSNYTNTLLKDGDELVTLNKIPYQSQSQYWQYESQQSPEKTYNITIRRDGQLSELKLTYQKQSLSNFLLNILIWLLLPLIFIATGVTVFFLRTDDKQAILLAILFCMIAAGPPAPGLVFASLPFPVSTVILFAYVFSWGFPAVLFHFFLIFPERVSLLNKYPALEKLLYVPWLIGLFPLAAIQANFWDTAPERFFTTAQEFPLLTKISLPLAGLYLLCGLASLIFKYQHASEISQRKMRVVLFGSVAGILPFSLLLTTVSSFGNKAQQLSLLMVIVFLLLLLVPFSFAYAILRHKVIPVSLIIRQGVQYLLAKNAIRFLLTLPLIGLVLTILANPNRTLADILLRNSIHFYILLFATLLLSLPFRQRLGAWIDRKFFREAYDREAVIHQLTEEVKQMDSINEMSRVVCQKVEAALHPGSVYLFYRTKKKKEFSLGYSSSHSVQPQTISSEFQLLRSIEIAGRAQEFPSKQTESFPANEKEWLEEMETRLIVPLNGSDGHLVGLFLLGEKKSEVPYTARDCELLETLASQIALVYENTILKERVAQDQKLKHEVLARLDGQQISLLHECSECGACFDSSITHCPNDESELTLSLPIERTIDERYCLDKRISKGGMGVVYQATDLRLNRRVAVKVLLGSLFGDYSALRRFEREAKASARLNHKNIVTVFDYGLLQSDGAFLVMEFVQGQTLGSIIKQDGAIHPSLTAELFNQILDGVKAAHDEGIIHRDLKPENILITQDENNLPLVKILDFGLAKLNQLDANETASAPTTTAGTIMGTFGYMSPEQLTGGEVDLRSDLFSVGVMAVETLTGKRPFGGETYHEHLNNLLQQEFHFLDDVDEIKRLDKVIQKCLAKNKEDRFANAEEMQRILIPSIRACPVLSTNNNDELEADTFIFNKISNA